LTICDYGIATRRKVNPRLSYKRYTIQILSELSKAIGIERKFIDMTRDDVLFYLDNCRKPENEDPFLSTSSEPVGEGEGYDLRT
jgi:hypothetical protein